MVKAILVIFFLIFVPGVAPARGTSLDRHKNNQLVERTIAADPRVLLSACVVSGNIEVRGWDRREVRARVSDGVQIELTRIDQTTSKPATELKLTLKTSRRMADSRCLSLGDIELDVPRGASLKLQTTNGDISVTEVARVSTISQSGDSAFTKVREEITASTIGGEISVRDSTGSFKLHSVGGSVEGINLGPKLADDNFQADTVGGDIMLNRIRHQWLTVNNVSGEVKYAGPLSRGGHYSFQSFSGRLLLLLPPDSSFRLVGSLGRGGDLKNDFHMKDNLGVVTKHGPTQSIDATAGTGDVKITLSIFSGSVEIRKQ